MRGTLGTIGFIARLAPMPPYCALFSALCSPSTTPSSPAALPFPYLGSGALAFYFYAYGYAYVPREHGGVFGPPAYLPGLCEVVPYLTGCQSYSGMVALGPMPE